MKDKSPPRIRETRDNHNFCHPVPLLQDVSLVSSILLVGLSIEGNVVGQNLELVVHP